MRTKVTQIIQTGDLDWPWKIIWGNPLGTPGLSDVDVWCVQCLEPDNYEHISLGWKFKNLEDAQALMLAWYDATLNVKE